MRGGATSAVEVTAGEDMVFGALQAGAKIEDINAMGVTGALEKVSAGNAERELALRNAAIEQQQMQANITAQINANGQQLIGQSNASLTSIAEQDQAIGQGAVPDGSYYSVAYETRLSSDLYSKGYYTHFKTANQSLQAAMNSDAAFAQSMEDLGMSFKTKPSGAINWGTSPNNFVWHHNVEDGLMQLVPKYQHTTNSIFWDTMHPGGVGGMYIWGQ